MGMLERNIPKTTTTEAPKHVEIELENITENFERILANFGQIWTVLIVLIVLIAVLIIILLSGKVAKCMKREVAREVQEYAI